MNILRRLTSYKSPSFSQDDQSSASFDYSGFDDLVKRQDAISATRDGKFGSLYGGDVKGAVAGRNNIRDLLSAVRVHEPEATERRPVRTVTPLQRITSTSGSSSQSGSGADFSLGGGDEGGGGGPGKPGMGGWANAGGVGGAWQMGNMADEPGGGPDGGGEPGEMGWDHSQSGDPTKSRQYRILPDGTREYV